MTTYIRKIEDDDDEVAEAAADMSDSGEPDVEELIDRLVKVSGGSRADAERWLKTSTTGRELLRRFLSKRYIFKRKDKQQMTSVSEIVAKAGGIEHVSKIIAEGGSIGLSEYDFTAQWISKLGSASAFAKRFESDQTMRTAHALCKAAPFDPVQAGGVASADMTGSTVSANKLVESAIAQLTALAEALRASSTVKMTKAQAFSRVYQDPANRALVELERSASHAANWAVSKAYG